MANNIPNPYSPAGGGLPMTTLGDTLYENATPAPARLAGNTTSNKRFLTQTGTGSVSAAPGWNAIVAGDVPGTLNATTFGGNLTAQDGLLFTAVTTKSTNYTVNPATDFLILVDTTAANVNVALPDATTCQGQVFSVKIIQDNNKATFTTVAGQTIDENPAASWFLGTDGNSIAVISDGSNWQTFSVTGMALDFNGNGTAFMHAIWTYTPISFRPGAGTDTSLAATQSVPTPTSGVAFQLSTSTDVILYIAIQTAAALAVAIGPTSTPAFTVMPSQSYALGLNTFRIPQGWWVKITGTIADLTLNAITC